MNKKAILPRHEVIARYWSNKYITRDGRITDKFVEDSVRIMDDVGEPCCWACDLPVITAGEEHNTDDLEKVWSYKRISDKLQRCHIVPEMLGGSTEPDNLFLLCKRCHAESPDTANREAFFRWVYDQKLDHVGGVTSPLKIMEEMDKELKRRDCPTFREMYELLPEDKRQVLVGCFCGEKNQEDMKRRIGMHEFYIKHNSMIVGIVDHLLFTFNNLTTA